jgi:hypothetical protein
MLLFLVLDYRHGFEALSVSRFKANVSSFYCNTKLALRNNNLSNYTKNLSLHRIHPMLQFFRVFWNKLKNKNWQTNHFHNKKHNFLKLLDFGKRVGVTLLAISLGFFLFFLPSNILAIFEAMDSRRFLYCRQLGVEEIFAWWHLKKHFKY